MAAQLVSLPEVERLSPRIIRILGGNPGKFTLQGTNTYLIGTGPSRILLDTAEGLPGWRSTLSRILTEEAATISTCILTHWHHDHVGGISDVLELCPKAKVYKFDPYDDGSQEPIVDKQVFEVEGASLTAVHSPGHTTDHVALLLKEEEGAMFLGDNVLGQGTAVFEDLATYLGSLKKMAELVGEKGRGYPGHGPVVDVAKEKIEEYVKHRQGRENQVVEVLKKTAEERKGGVQSMGIVKVIYVEYPESLHEPARHGILQILKKLEGEGKVSREGEDGWVWGSGGKPTL